MADRSAILTPSVLDCLRTERSRLAICVILRPLPLEPDVYTGASGVGLMCLKLAMGGDMGGLGPAIETMEKQFFEHARRLPYRLRGRGVAFLCGDLGSPVVALGLAKKAGIRGDWKERAVEVARELAAEARTIENDELFYGRAGFLYGALFMNACAGKAIVPSAELEELAEGMVASGLRHGRERLSYRWKGAEYLGAAHGLAGILSVLLRFPRIVAAHGPLLRASLDALVSMRLPSGNYPAVAELPREDVFMQWCHGATGIVPLLCLAARVLDEPSYLKAAEASADVVWRRGLLRKGLGLCHGISGTGYALLALYRATGNLLYLHRAVQLGLFCVGEGGQRLHYAQERFLSLYEGLAGCACFLDDLLHPEASWMPGYELPGDA